MASRKRAEGSRPAVVRAYRRRVPVSQYPLCATCHTNRVKGRNNRFCSPQCVPRAIRADNCRRGRKTYAYRRRAVMLKRFLDRVSGRTITREVLCDLLWEFGKVRYQAGFQVGRSVAKRGDDWRQALADAQERGAA